MSKINVKDTEITIISNDGEDFVSLTDMIKAKDGDFFVSDWLRNRNTVEFLSVWETIHNPSFNYGEYAIIASKAGLNNYKISVKEWINKTGAIGLKATSGRYGGTYAHKDIAFEFGMWISAEFKLLLIKEFQLLKERENNDLDQIWDVRRFLSKANYRIQTDAIKDVLIPLKNLSKDKEGFVYANEADLLYVAMYGYTAKQWRDDNPDKVAKGKNLRDYADTHQLIVLTNLESLNAEYIRLNLSSEQRISLLRKAAIEQLKSLRKSLHIEDLKIESPNLESSKPIFNRQDNSFDKNVNLALNKEKKTK